MSNCVGVVPLLTILTVGASFGSHHHGGGGGAGTTRLLRRPPLSSLQSPAKAGRAPGSQPEMTSMRGKSVGTVAYLSLPLSFEANQGQTDPHVSFLSRG